MTTELTIPEPFGNFWFHAPYVLCIRPQYVGILYVSGCVIRCPCCRSLSPLQSLITSPNSTTCENLCRYYSSNNHRLYTTPSHPGSQLGYRDKRKYLRIAVVQWLEVRHLTGSGSFPVPNPMYSPPLPRVGNNLIKLLYRSNCRATLRSIPQMEGEALPSV